MISRGHRSRGNSTQKGRDHATNPCRRTHRRQAPRLRPPGSNPSSVRTKADQRPISAA